MTTGIKCDKCDAFIQTEPLEGKGYAMLEDYVQANFMNGKAAFGSPIVNIIVRLAG